MKFDYPAPKFPPLTITVETSGEAYSLMRILQAYRLPYNASAEPVNHDLASKMEEVVRNHYNQHNNKG